MADETKPGTDAAPQAGSTAAPAAPSQPSGEYTSVLKTDWAQAQRWREQAAGSQRLFERSKELGFDKPEDVFGTWGESLKSLKSRGIDPERLARAFSVEEEPDNQTPDISKLVAAEVGKFKSELQAERAAEALESHSGILNGHMDSIRDMVAKAVGDAKDEEMTEFVLNAAVQKYNSLRKNYPEKHPLHRDYVAPPTDKQLAEVGEYVKSRLSKFRGSALDAVANAASKASTSSPAGTGRPESGAGKPKTNNDDDDRADLDRQAKAMALRLSAKRAAAAS